MLFGQGYDILMPLKANRAGRALIDSMKPAWGATAYLAALQAADACVKTPDAASGKFI